MDFSLKLPSSYREWREYFLFRYKILRKPIGLSRNTTRDNLEKTSFHIMAINKKNEIIGVAQVLNKKKGRFTKEDLGLLEAITTQASIALQSTQFVEKMIKTREKEMEFLDVVSDVTVPLVKLGTTLAENAGWDKPCRIPRRNPANITSLTGIQLAQLIFDQ